MTDNHKREQILKAAINLFACTGYSASNVPSIAKSANVTVGSIYHYFKNKQDILNVALQTTLNSISSELTNIFQTNSTTETAYNALFEIGSQFIKEETTTVHFLYGNLYNPDLTLESIQSRKKVTNLIINFLKNGQDEKVFVKSDLHTQLALLIGSLFMTGNFYWISENVEGEEAPQNIEITHLKKQIWNGLTTQ